MNVLKDILYKVSLLSASGDMARQIASVSFDSRNVSPGAAFVAVRGSQVDGHRFIEKAIEKGAVAVVCEELPDRKAAGVTYVAVNNSSEALGVMASNFYDHPGEKLRLVGITGTNGKTTIATLLYSMYRKLGIPAGLISTVENKINDETIPSVHTTPDAIQLNQLLKRMVDRGCRYCFMEVSSHALDQHRVAGIFYSGAVFSNITHDHLDYHKTFDEYIKAKKKLFDGLPADAFALVNTDDRRGRIMIQNTKARKVTYALKGMADHKAKLISNTLQGLELEIDGQSVWFRLIGGFNAYNLLAAYAVAVLLGEDKEQALTALSSLNPVEGRFEVVKSPAGIIAIVDYAHTPDALENVLSTIGEFRTNNEQVLTVIGCGGDRDADKRPLMASIACKMSDKVFLTSDNPRYENPDTIIDHMKKGVSPVNYKKTIALTDREEAIKAACAMAQPADIILVAGKGHEKYQEIEGVRHPFDDKEVLEKMLNLFAR